ncbi:MAG: flagellar biosynthesis anti-sigma factor FlgM [Proteobacteria bacterium]|nr:MAG: flagellar biosynthesis anti-sigma factor FlgM [Pseudomonadota bacterium]
MKIDNSVKSVGTTPAGEQRAKATAAATPSAPAGDQVQLSSGLQKAEQAIAATPVVDQARVDEIKQAISDGHFKVDANKVADGLIESVRQMLAHQPRQA